MKKILSFTDYYWPGYKAGGTIRAFMNQVDYLKGEFEFFIVTRNTDYTDPALYPQITPGHWTHPEPNVHIFYASAEQQGTALWYSLLKERTYDAVYIHLLFGWWYSILPLFLAKIAGIPEIVVAPHGVLGQGALGVKPFRKKVFLRLFRMAGLYRGTVFHSVTEHETRDIRKHIGQKVKIAFALELPRKVSRPPNRRPKEQGILRVVTVARVSPEKNQEYALKVLAECRGCTIRYDLIGPVYDQVYWGRCRQLMATLPAGITATYRGSIHSEKIPEALQQYDLMLLPTTGENFGHTILESFMAGCPVIISDQTPWKGLANEGIGHDIPLQQPEAFTSELEFFADLDDTSHAEFSKKAYTFALAYCDNPEMLGENKRLFDPGT